MDYLIIEDEPLAAHSLELLIKELEPEWTPLSVLQTIEESIEWLNENPAPALIFMDIHLADGSSFGIFSEAKVESPLIFTTAYDEYALRAFEVNSVDYLLKPIAREDLARAIGKFHKIKGSSDAAIDGDLIGRLANSLRQRMLYSSSLLVSQRDKLIPVPVDDIAYIQIENKIVTAVTFGGTRYNLDQTMEQLQRQLDPSSFYRANRQYIVARRAIRDLSVWFGSKLALNLSVPTEERITVSRTNVRDFKKWITGTEN